MGAGDEVGVDIGLEGFSQESPLASLEGFEQIDGVWLYHLSDGTITDDVKEVEAKTGGTMLFWEPVAQDSTRLQDGSPRGIVFPRSPSDGRQPDGV